MDLKTIVLLLLTITSLIGGGFIYFKERRQSINNTLLAIFLGLLGFIFLHSFTLNYFGYNNSHPLIVLLSYLFFVFCLALAPTFYLYTKSLVLAKEEIFIGRNMELMYAPAIFLLVINLFSYVALYNIEPGSQNYLMVETVFKYCNFVSLFFIFLLQNIYFIYSGWKFYFLQKVILKGSQSKESNFTLKWMWWFIVLFTLLIASLYIFQIKPLLAGKFVFRVFTIFYVLAIIYFGSKNYRFVIENKQSHQMDLDKRNNLRKSILNYMQVNKPHLNNELDLNTLAKSLGTNSKYLSYVINKEFNCNFPSFINTYRVKEAKNFLSDPNHNIYTIETIAKMTGFKSKSAFNSAFKKETNLTPSAFKLKYTSSRQN